MIKQGIKSKWGLLFSIAIACLLFIASGCKFPNGKGTESKTTDSTNGLEKGNKKSNTLYSFNNVVFSIPSPYEFAYFVKNLGINYSKDYLNPTANAASYSSSFKKATNLGLYGTDLGYLTIYEQTPDAVSYFSTVKTMANDLGLTSVFGQKTMSRIEKNMGNRDSLMFILSTSYRETDAYLKDNDRKATAALVLTGSWIESQYILTQIAKIMPVKEVYQRIAEQKHPLDNLIKILSTNYNKDDKDFVEMTGILVELAYEYDGIDYIYEYKKPIHNPKNHFTIIQSVSELQINPEPVKSITKLTEKLRAIITKK
jgi:hypothetical protein